MKFSSAHKSIELSTLALNRFEGVLCTSKYKHKLFAMNTLHDLDSRGSPQNDTSLTPEIGAEHVPIRPTRQTLLSRSWCHASSAQRCDSGQRKETRKGTRRYWKPARYVGPCPSAYPCS